MTNPSLPGSGARLVDTRGAATVPFYKFMVAIANAVMGTASEADIAGVEQQIAALQAEIDALPENAFPVLQVQAPLQSNGLLQNGFAQLAVNVADSITVAGNALQLAGDALAPGNTLYYGTAPTGAKGWNTVASALAVASTSRLTDTVGENGVSTFDLATTGVTAGSYGNSTNVATFTVDAYGRLTAAEATAISFPVTAWNGRTGAVTPQANDYSVGQIAGLIIPQGYIDGLQMVWNSATSISVTSGTAYIPSLGNVLVSNSTLTLSGLSLAASTWYHVYLYSNAGTPAIECVTTAPVNYYGTAYQKTGDDSRRYVGSVLTDASSNIRNFKHSGSRYSWMQNVANGLDVFRILSNGKAITATAIDASGAMSETAFSALLRGSNLDTSIPVFLMAGDYTPSSTADGQISLKQNLVGFFEIASDASQRFKYQWTSSPTGGLYLDLIAFNFAR